MALSREGLHDSIVDERKGAYLTAMTELTHLVQAAQAGDRAAFGQLVIRFQDLAFAGAYAVVGDAQTAQDVAQEAFLEAYRTLDKLREPAAFPGWFRRIVLGRSHRELRQQPRGVTPLERVDTLHLALDDPAERIDHWHLQNELTQALATLPAAQRLVVMLFYIEGYSYQELAAFLEVPLSTVKKRLFDARRKLSDQLQGRMLHMVRDRLQQSKPSQDAHFAQQVQFFLAIRAGDLATIKTLVAQNPTLLQVQTEWKMALGLHYWPLGSTALHLAAGMGSTALLAYLLAQPIAVDTMSRGGMTALQVAVIMQQTASVQLLLDHNADPNLRSAAGYPALHLAVMREYGAIAALLLKNGSDLALLDNQGRSALDWAVAKQNQRLVDLLVSYGAPQVDLPAAPVAPAASPQPTLAPTQFLGAVLHSDGAVRTPAEERESVAAGQSTLFVPPHTPLLPTGIKLIDLLAPLARGGQNGIFTSLSGAGLVVLIGQIIASVASPYQKAQKGSAVWLMQESTQYRAEEQRLNWRELGVNHDVVYVTSAPAADPTARWQTIETGVRIANQFQANGQEVLLLVDSQLAALEGALAYLRSNVAVTPAAAVTTLINGHHTPGALPAMYAGLDALLAFDYTRASYRLFPALDPLRSYSTLLDRGLVSADHRTIANAVKQLFQRYSELRAPMEQHKLTTDDLWYIEDDPDLATTINRAQRLDRFLTQPFAAAEPWTGIMGQWVSLDDTLAGCQAILAGHYDDVPQETLAYIGKIAEARAKALVLD